MRAIRLTQVLKDDNPEFFKNLNVDTIYRATVPNTFVRGGQVVFGYKDRLDLQELDGWKDIIEPQFNATTQFKGGLIDNPNDPNTFTYEVVDYTLEQLQGQILANAESERQQKLQEEQVRIVEEKFQAIETVEDILANESAFPLWRNFEDGTNFAIDFKVRDFNAEGELKVYKVIQAHNKQSDWNPIAVPALFVLVQEEGATEWEAGAQYEVGDIRTYEGVEYICIQAHTSQVGWQPPNVPSLWNINV